MDARFRLDLLRQMLYARRFEERCYEAYVERRIGGFLHLYPGQEACAIGVMAAARPGHDCVITGYRDHVHCLATGSDPKAVMAELYGKATGCSGGYGGSMHLFDVARRFYGGYAIVGGPFPLAAGLALGLKMRGEDAIAICFLGDAANNQGTFHESLNMASVWKLPVLYVCENNLYGIGTAIQRSTAELDQWKRALPYNIPSSYADGQDVDAVLAAATTAVEHVRGTGTPYFLELKTYRFRGHSMSDSGKYRSKEEEEEWKRRDPIVLLKTRLIAEGALRDDDYKAMDQAILQSIEHEVVGFAESSPTPPADAAALHVLAPNDPFARGPFPTP